MSQTLSHADSTDILVLSEDVAEKKQCDVIWKKKQTSSLWG